MGMLSAYEEEGGNPIVGVEEKIEIVHGRDFLVVPLLLKGRDVPLMNRAEFPIQRIPVDPQFVGFRHQKGSTSLLRMGGEIEQAQGFQVWVEFCTDGHKRPPWFDESKM